MCSLLTNSFNYIFRISKGLSNLNISTAANNLNISTAANNLNISFAANSQLNPNSKPF